MRSRLVFGCALVVLAAALPMRAEPGPNALFLLVPEVVDLESAAEGCAVVGIPATTQEDPLDPTADPARQFQNKVTGGRATNIYEGICFWTCNDRHLGSGTDPIGGPLGNTCLEICNYRCNGPCIALY